LERESTEKLVSGSAELETETATAEAISKEVPGCSIFAEELLRVFNEANDHNDGGSGHAYKEHDLKDVHCQ
jgi:hypothetical protein